MPMDEKLKNDIEAHVAAIFSAKEEAEMRKQTEEALQKAAVIIEDLTNSLEEKNTEVEELEVKLSEDDTKISDLESELEAAREEVDHLKTQISEKENELDGIKKDRAADVRMAELQDAGVVQRSEEAKANQTAKVREMSDDEFAAYRDELISIRQAVLEELVAAANEEETVEEKESAENKEEAGEEEATEEESEVEAEETASDEEATLEDETASEEDEEEEVQPANIDYGKAVFAALNMEHRASSDMIDKYNQLGKAMAEAITKKSR